MKKSLSIPSANLLYLVSMLLVLFLGSTVQTLNLTLGIIATEVFLIALPAVILLLIKKIPIKDGLRLNPIKPGIAVISILLGVSTYVFSILIEQLMMKLSGTPSVDVPAGAMPEGTLFYILYFLALAIFAPVCEEILFRGAIQGAYENKKNAWFAITLPTLMFAFYHFRLSGLPGLLPVAFIMGFVAFRTRSIVSSTLVHFGINAIAAIVTILALNGITIIKEFSNLVIVSLIGLAVTLILLYLFIRLQPKPEPYEAVEEAPVKWFKKYWALLVAGILYAAVVGLTLYAQLTGATASTNLTYTRPELTAPVESRYQSVNHAGDVVGEMNCVVTPQGATFSLVCDSEVEAFEIKIGNSMWKDEGHTGKLIITWQTSTNDLLDYSYVMTSDKGGVMSALLEDGNLVYTTPYDEHSTALPEEFLIDFEWPWKVSSLDNNGGLFYKSPYVYLNRWDNDAKKNVTLIQDD
ncbi:MAG: CPBP family intramembrane metalloprotease [Anaerolineae bacterium]|nr:CPBP family intramembrane metalloprotease [Anaerolineae bacterium]